MLLRKTLSITFSPTGSCPDLQKRETITLSFPCCLIGAFHITHFFFHMNNVQFGSILEKLVVCQQLLNVCTYVTYMVVIIFRSSKLHFQLIDFQLYRFPFPILHFQRNLFNDWFLKKMLLIRAKSRRLYIAKLQTQIILLL